MAQRGPEPGRPLCRETRAPADPPPLSSSLLRVALPVLAYAFAQHPTPAGESAPSARSFVLASRVQYINSGTIMVCLCSELFEDDKGIKRVQTLCIVQGSNVKHNVHLITISCAHTVVGIDQL